VSASPTPSTTDLAKAKVISTYTGFWNTAVQAWTQGSLDNVQVDKYAVDDGDYLIKSALEYYISQNLVMRGRPVLHPVVSVINLTKKPYTATVSDCIDDTNFYPVNKTTGTPATLAKTGHRHPASYQERFDGQWWVVNGSIDRTKTC
jgi:hypothetical protein